MFKQMSGWALCCCCCLLVLNWATQLTEGLVCNNVFNIEYYTIDNYTDHMCTFCFDSFVVPNEYDFMWNDSNLINNQWNVSLVTKGNLVHTHLGDRRLIYAELLKYIDKPEQHFLLSQFSSNHTRNIFLQCCKDALDCCHRMQQQKTPQGPCPIQWDGSICWDEGTVNSFSSVPCADKIYLNIFDHLPPKCTRPSSTKQCTEHGWKAVYHSYYKTTVEYTDNTQCFEPLAKSVRLTLSDLRLWLESISLFCVLLAIALFLYYRLYTQIWLQIHLNFFISIAFASAISIIYELLVTRAHLVTADNTTVLQSPFQCKLLTFLYRDSHLITFCWMLIEGFNFHHFVVFTFYDLSRYKLPIYLIGWLFPNLVMLVYVGIRLTLANDTCWTDAGIYDLAYILVPYLCAAINLVLLINLIRVIIIKLMISKNNFDYVSRGVKTSLVLIPVFGVQYICHVVPVDPTETCSNLKLSLEYLQVLIEGLQGLIVATTLCFINKEVHICIRKSINRLESSSILTFAQTISDYSRRSS